MAGLNIVQIIGYLGKDPDLRQTQGGTAVASMSVATTRKWVDKNKETKEETEWHRVTCWGKTAELVEKYLHKGSLVYVQGRLRTSSYEDKEGVKRWSTDVVAERVQFLDRKGGGDGRPHPSAMDGAEELSIDFDEEIPF